jgi:hypothetical protein
MPVASSLSVIEPVMRYFPDNIRKFLCGQDNGGNKYLVEFPQKFQVIVRYSREEAVSQLP